MLKKPPPIQWLPVFEAAARRLNFKQAAEELCVSPPAVSQQIKVLEEYLGVSLFDRSTKKLRLTKAGEFYYQHAHNIIQQHVKSYRDFERAYRYPTLQVSAPIFIAQELLIPSYREFNDYAPGVELRLTTGNEYIDFEHESLDAALRFGTGNWPELECRLVSKIVPRLVCSPAYLKQHDLTDTTMMSKDVLQDHVLLSIFEDFRDWKSLYSDLHTDQKIILDSYFSVMRSAEEGLGIAVGLTPVINRLLNENKLVLLNSELISTDYSYWLVAPRNRASSDNIDALFNWIKTQFDSL